MSAGLIWRGHPVCLRFQKSGGFHLRQDAKHRWMLLAPESTAPEEAAAFLREYGRDALPEYETATSQNLERLLRSWSERLGLPETPALQWTENRYIWGQANPEAGVILLHRSLLQAPEACAEEVLVHELCHFRYFAHDRSFWRLLASCIPDWAAREGLLRCRPMEEKLCFTEEI